MTTEKETWCALCEKDLADDVGVVFDGERYCDQHCAYEDNASRPRVYDLLDKWPDAEDKGRFGGGQ